ncbi:hypothetical protein GIS00_07730 [Nakamurella sp. YIM 132087]|uniref:Uncharacterized protein n=1 Tax=Nakamurella alba TaxID=2665158 RepID=A0A7K1FIB9_9ACTN|nr:hypothetical protein [Nakamurella alba]MTD13830.1 hypothetical protein [Nakamurella alba]
MTTSDPDQAGQIDTTDTAGTEPGSEGPSTTDPAAPQAPQDQPDTTSAAGRAEDDAAATADAGTGAGDPAGTAENADSTFRPTEQLPADLQAADDAIEQARHSAQDAIPEVDRTVTETPDDQES